jgi:hypothetical protein
MAKKLLGLQFPHYVSPPIYHPQPQISNTQAWLAILNG